MKPNVQLKWVLRNFVESQVETVKTSHAFIMDLQLRHRELVSTRSIHSHRAIKLNCNETRVRIYVRGGARRGLEEAIVPLSEHASPPSEGEMLFCRRFLAFTIP